MFTHFKLLNMKRVVESETMLYPQEIIASRQNPKNPATTKSNNKKFLTKQNMWKSGDYPEPVETSTFDEFPPNQSLPQSKRRRRSLARVVPDSKRRIVANLEAD